MTLQSYLRIFRERYKVLALVTLLCVAVAVLITALTPKTYQADVQIFVTSNGDIAASGVGQYDQQAAALSQVTTFSQLVDTPRVIDTVRTDLNLDLSDSQLRGKISASAPSQQTLVVIHATDGSRDRAEAIAKSAASAFIKVVEDLKRPTDSSKSTVRLFATSQALASSTPISPKPTLNIVVGLILGLLLGAVVAVARDILDNRVKDVEALAKLTRKAAMGTILHDPRIEKFPVASRAGSRNMRAENFRQLRANLQFANVDDHPRTIAVTSSVPGEGKTMVAINLASTLAEAGFSVCLVDADLRRPSIAKTLGLNEQVGLTSLLIQQLGAADVLQEMGTNLFVLTSGPTPPNPSELLASTYVRDVIRSLLDLVDYVILDTAPLLPVADGSEVAAMAEGTLLVARHKTVTEPQVRRAMTALSRVNARVLGVVLNDVPPKSDTYGYSYSYSRIDTQADLQESPPRFGRRSRAGHRVDSSAPTRRGDEVDPAGARSGRRDQAADAGTGR